MTHPERKSTRIPGYDYATPNYYFITICTHNKQCLFGSVEQLNGHGQIAHDLLLEIPKHYPNASVDKFVVMPNQISTPSLSCTNPPKAAVSHCLS